MSLKVSIVILTYNQLHEATIACLESVQEYTDLSMHELIVVDNCSDDGTVEYLKKLKDIRPEFTIILNEANLGYAGGNNCGIRASGNEFVILLNNDTLVSPDWVEKLCASFVNSAIGLVGPISNSVGNHQVIDFEGISEQNYLDVTSDYVEKRTGLCYATRNLGFFCVAIRRQVINEIGLLDPDFGIGMFEDDEYCRRAQNCGWELAIREDCFIYHKGSVSFNRLDRKVYQKQFQKNKGLFYRKTGSTWAFSDISIGYCQQIVEFCSGLKMPSDLACESIRRRERSMLAIIERVRRDEISRKKKRKIGLSNAFYYLKKDPLLLCFKIAAFIRRKRKPVCSHDDLMRTVEEIQKISKGRRFILVIPGVDFQVFRLFCHRLFVRKDSSDQFFLFLTRAQIFDRSFESKPCKLTDSFAVASIEILKVIDHLAHTKDVELLTTDIEFGNIPRLKVLKTILSKSVFDSAKTLRKID